MENKTRSRLIEKNAAPQGAAFFTMEQGADPDWTELPNEVYERIFCHLYDAKQTKPFRATCRRFRALANALYLRLWCKEKDAEYEKQRRESRRICRIFVWKAELCGTIEDFANDPTLCTLSVPLETQRQLSCVMPRDQLVSGHVELVKEENTFCLDIVPFVRGLSPDLWRFRTLRKESLVYPRDEFGRFLTDINLFDLQITFQRADGNTWSEPIDNGLITDPEELTQTELTTQGNAVVEFLIHFNFIPPKDFEITHPFPKPAAP